MQRSGRILTCTGVGAAMLLGALSAGAAERFQEARGKFVRLIERKVGEHEYLGIVLQPTQGDGETTVLLARGGELGDQARRLRKGQKLEIQFVIDGGQKWATRIDAGRPKEGDRERRREGERKPDREREGRTKEGDRERERRREGEARRDREREGRREGQARERGEGERSSREGGEARELRELLRRLNQRLDNVERQLRRLREENARLRRELGLKRRSGGEAEGKARERPEGERRDRERKERRLGEGKRRDRERREGERGEGRSVLPAGMRGFRGMLRGTLRSKGERSFVLKVEKVVKTWEHSKASNPAAAVGRELTLAITPDSRLAGRHVETFKKLKPGDRVVVEAFHTEGTRLKVIEELRKAD